MVALDAQPALEDSRTSSGVLQRPVRSSAGSVWSQALIQIHRHPGPPGFDRALWSSCRGQGNSRRANWRRSHPPRRTLTNAEQAAGGGTAPSPSPHILSFPLTPRNEPRAERATARAPVTPAAPAPEWLRSHDRNWLSFHDRSHSSAFSSNRGGFERLLSHFRNRITEKRDTLGVPSRFLKSC